MENRNHGGACGLPRTRPHRPRRHDSTDHETLISRKMLVEVPLSRLSFALVSVNFAGRSVGLPRVAAPKGAGTTTYLASPASPPKSSMPSTGLISSAPRIDTKSFAKAAVVKFTPPQSPAGVPRSTLGETDRCRAVRPRSGPPPALPRVWLWECRGNSSSSHPGRSEW
jgi:hypothetical protein